MNSDAPLRVAWPARAHVIAIGAEKAGAGKTTLALNVAAALLRAGRKVGVVDLDHADPTLSRFLSRISHVNLVVAAPADAAAFHARLEELSARCAYIVIDTPSALDGISPVAHACADTLVTALAHGGELGVAAPGASLAPSGYSEMVWEARKQKLRARGGPIDWVVLRNRLDRASAKDDATLAALSGRMGFRIARGLSERAIVHELFAQGRDLLDSAGGLSMTHVVARQEFREFLLALKLPELRSAVAA